MGVEIKNHQENIFILYYNTFRDCKFTFAAFKFYRPNLTTLEGGEVPVPSLEGVTSAGTEQYFS